MMIVGVVGAGSCSPETAAVAFDVGRELAARGAAVICGGLGGVMEAACRGAREAGGVTIGVLPGQGAADANPYVDFPIVTGMGEARNLLIVRSAAVLIAIGGEYGTLSEVAFALKLGVPVIGLGTWELSLPGTSARAPIERVDDARRAVERALSRGAGCME
jgi:uncharacterized protein (TIGR00725 family)